ncbi:MAG: PA2169 family four-helix-bundle protein [Candidatus Angelobacter sp.]
MTDNGKILDVLHELIEVCKDGETGYTHAAGIVSDPKLRSYFQEQSLERAHFVQDLKHAAEILGDKPDTSGSVAATLHRLWFEAKADLGLGDQSVLNSVEQGEDRAKHAYEDALHEDLPADIRGMLQQHAQSVFAAHDYVRDLRDRDQEKAA